LSLASYGDYCINDTELTYQLYCIFARVFPKEELKVIDITLRMFIDPVLKLNTKRLNKHLKTLVQEKEDLLQASGMDKKSLMSGPKFAKELEKLGVIPPMKISLRTGEPTFAFAKTDEEFKKLQEHEDPVVQALIAARIGLKTTLEETRTERFLSIASRGLLPAPIKYYAAHTGRWGGYDKVNLQNLPSRGPKAKVLKSCLTAPKGYTIIDGDSSQIEARILAWLSEHTRLVNAFANDEDVYKIMAAQIYDKDVENITDAERFIGKTTILGAGYGMGAERFKDQLKTFGVDITIEEVARIIKVYRNTNYEITTLWREAQTAITGMYQGDSYKVGKEGVIEVLGEQKAIRVPSGLLMRYGKLEAQQGEKGVEFSYFTRTGRTRIYGGKLVENICQALAKCVIAEQMVRLNKKYRPILTVHDSLILCVPTEELEDALEYAQDCLRWTPKWATGLPLDCELAYGNNCGELTKWV
jgi:DNA polymerase I-like protein with 3'-5' exonuclease and polymerase domains